MSIIKKILLIKSITASALLSLSVCAMADESIAFVGEVEGCRVIQNGALLIDTLDSKCGGARMTIALGQNESVGETIMNRYIAACMSAVTAKKRLAIYNLTCDDGNTNAIGTATTNVGLMK